MVSNMIAGERGFFAELHPKNVRAGLREYGFLNAAAITGAFVAITGLTNAGFDSAVNFAQSSLPALSWLPHYNVLQDSIAFGLGGGIGLSYVHLGYEGIKLQEHSQLQKIPLQDPFSVYREAKSMRRLSSATALLWFGIAALSFYGFDPSHLQNISFSHEIMPALDLSVAAINTAAAVYGTRRIKRLQNQLS